MAARRSTTLRPLRFAAVSAATAIVVAGCAAGPTPTRDAGSQSLTDACAIVRAEVDAAMSAFGEIDPSDPARAGAALGDVVDSLAVAQDAIDNAELAATVARLHEGFTDLRDGVTAAADGDISGLAGLGNATDEIRSASTAFQDSCGT
ncbi:hypothetical protein [Microbacterium dauci]|uniref:Uncharacterized protein n=1 Tax=Microbacterium dauci TaxID=3048008 RepID=A0ABT6Z9K6_9MICO|nr:hypothetical protein [Microbacterium sp. LX3-4]MDJ1112848.1 hypothetical protein [Microbacterium sp. LX3-4]